MVQLISNVERKNRILNRFAETKDDKFLMEECFMWTLEQQVWQDIGVLNYPAPPKEWVEYENLGEVQKAKISGEFFQQFAVKEYLAKKSWLYAINFAHWDWIKKMSAFFPRDGEHIVLHERIDEKLAEFNRWFSNYCPAMDKLKEVFSARRLTDGSENCV